MSDAVNTGKVTEHRSLQFRSINDLLAEIDRIVASDRNGTLRRTGNWTAGQTFGHLATWINYGYEGFPPKAHPPFFIRWILKLRKNRYIRDSMPRGVRIPGIKEGTLGTEPLSTEEGAAKLRAALAKLKKREPVKYHSPAFGEMSDEEREAFQLRHAEGHLGYLYP